MAFRDESSAYCKECGRALYNPVSVKRGIGPKCWASQQKQEDAIKTNDEVWDKCKDKEAED